MLGALLTLPLSLLIAQPPAMPPGAANARVAGRVVEAETGAPVSGAFVLLVPVVQSFPAAAMGPPQALTDTNGEFAVERVWAGRYRIEIQKTGFAPVTDVPDAPILDIQAGQSVTGLAFAMKKESVIAGRIVDAGGEPLSQITVAALRPLPGGDGRSFVGGRTMQMSQTNDRGEFRLAGLAKGHYVVIAAPRPPLATSQPVGGTVLAPTYYPGTPDREAAHVIDVGAAQTIDGIQFALVAVPAHQVTGIVVDQAGSPQAGVMLTLMAGPEAVGAMGPPMMVQTDQAGTFTIGGVVAGTYRVMAMIPIAVAFRNGAGASAGMRNGVGGVFGAAGGIGVAVPVGGIQTQGLPSTEVTVDATDVIGVRIVVPARHP